MKIHSLEKLSEKEIASLCSRNALDDPALDKRVAAILEDVRKNGDAALRRYAARFDKARLKALAVGKARLERLASAVPLSDKAAIRKAHRNISKFHAAQLGREKKVETAKGVTCWRETRPIRRVGLYVPGGTAVLPSTLLMLAVPARIAGCPEIVVCSPPTINGSVNPHIAYCATLLGIDRIYLAGGAQAVAAMAYGTRTIPRVDKIFGPGNRYVTQAKNRVSFLGAAAIDFPAGPSEVLVIADASVDPDIAASDLLSAADHGSDSQVVLVSPSLSFIRAVLGEVNRQAKYLGRSGIIAASLAKSFAVHTRDLGEAVSFSNRYAPEHLILSCENYRALIPAIENAGSVFLGRYSPESAGDYASGTNHTLPTSGLARSHSGLSVEAYVKKITFQEITPAGLLNIGNTIETFAEIERLPGHKNAVTLRVASLNR